MELSLYSFPAKFLKFVGCHLRGKKVHNVKYQIWVIIM